MSTDSKRHPGRSQSQVLALATEVGSAKAILPVLVVLVGRGVGVRAFLPSAALRLARELPGLVSEGIITAIAGENSIEEIAGNFLPDVFIVGTTPLDSLERRLTLYGRKRNIRTLAIVDERYGYRYRFSDEANSLTYLPDIVTVMDGECYEYAVEEGLPPSRVWVTGSPILSYLAYHLPNSQGAVSLVREGLDASWKQVAFLSEPFARDNGSSPGSRGRLGEFRGFTEETVRADLVHVLQDIGQPTLFVEKLYPSDTTEPKEGWLGNRLYWKQVRDVELWPLLWESDAVVGMKSMAVLEAALLGCRVASYQPDLIGENLCGAVRFGVAAKLDTRQDLKGWLLDSLSAENRRISRPTGLPFIRPDAAKRVADLALGVSRDA